MRQIIRLSIIAVVTVLLVTYVATPVRIVGQSMEPTYREGAWTVVNRLAYRFGHAPARGEIVAVRYAGRRVMLLKRVIGLPGETIAIENGTVEINGEALAEPYLLEPDPWDYPAQTLTGDEYFIIGDNRRQSLEEHLFGLVNGSQIAGRALW